MAASAALHVALIALAITGSWRIDRPQGLITIIPPSTPQLLELPPYGGTRPGKGPSGGMGRPLPQAAVPDTTPAVPAPVGKPDTTLAASPVAVGPHIVNPPRRATAGCGCCRVPVSPPKSPTRSTPRRSSGTPW